MTSSASGTSSAEGDSENIDFEAEKRDYFGKARGMLFRVVPCFDHIFLTRLYSNGKDAINLSWRFNMHGRLDLVDLLVRRRDNRPVKEVRHIMKLISDNDPKRKDWEQGSVTLYNDAPYELNIINDNFFHLPSYVKYDRLAKYGHVAAQDAVSGIREGDLENFKTVNGQMPIGDLKDDPTALLMLDRAASLRPYFTMDYHLLGTLRYILAQK